MKTSTFLASYGEYITNRDFDIAGALKREGFDAGEPDHYSFYRREEDAIEGAKKLRERFDEEGLAISCYSRGMTMIDTPREESIARLKASIDVCDILGSKIFHHTLQNTFHNPRIPLWQKHVDLFAELCREAAYYAGEKGITCVYEDQGFLVNTPDRLGEILVKVDMKNTGICLDTGNSLFHEIDPIEFVQVLAPYIKHVHVKDYIKKPFDKVPSNSPSWYRTSANNLLRPTIVGHGIIDFESIFATLILAGYDGYFSLESGGIEYDNIKGVAESLENMKWLYNKAKDGLIARGWIK